MQLRKPARIARREFLAGLGVWTGAATLVPAALTELNSAAGTTASGLPMRVLGRTGAKVTILGLGSAPIGHSQPGAAAGVAVYRAALEAGINYVDTAHIYDDAESYLGELVPQWRDKIFLATKARPESENAREATRQMQDQFEQSLRRLKTDHVDLLHIHSVTDRDPAMILAAGGPMEFVRRMKDQGRTRFIGVTAHNRHARIVPLIASGGVDVVMVALNFADYHQYRFEEDILPVARQHQCGILAMKVYGGHVNNFPGYPQRGPAKMPAEHLERALRYSLGIPGVAGAVVGVYAKEEIEQSVMWAKRWKPLAPDEVTSLREEGRKLAVAWGPRFGPIT
jgi:predicted aldo/keto reductase-like oxidoreductase